MNQEPLSEADIRKIEREIQAVIDTLITGCEALDMEMAFSMFVDDPAFVMMGTDGSLCDYQTYLKNNIDYLSTCSSFTLTTHRGEVRVIDPTTAVYAWGYGVEAVLKTGEKDIIENAGASFLFKKRDGEWVVVYYHEASVPPVRISPA